MSTAEGKLVRIQERGQITIPVQLRRKLGLKKGDFVAVVDAGDALLITRQEVMTAAALDRIGDILKKQGLSLHELIESGREQRGEIVEEEYGIDPDDPGN